MKPIAVHFGAGALGRGLVVPLLIESGFDVIAIDSDEKLLASIRERQGYDLLLTDTRETQHIHLRDIFHPADEKLTGWLQHASVITTSVRKENLHRIVKQLKNVPPKTLICCENIEYSGRFFAELMQEGGVNPDGWRLPDCMVDRICSSCWPASTLIEAESWGTVCIQKLEGATTVQKFEQVENITLRFQEKRILVNTYADGISFLGLAAGKQYLYQAAESEEIRLAMDDYMQLMKLYLCQECHLDANYLEKMAEKHRLRLCNPHIKRSLESVARNFLQKVGPTERFIYPLTVLQQRGVDIQPAISFLNVLINGWANAQSEPQLARQQALASLNVAEIVERLEQEEPAQIS
ncbi:TPA: mannitol dehydrogenase [Escherichia albertii]|uniref:mannitol dehydrogenase n=1 Tax=Escherichia albertii TaxID=208962 RepID=UPI0023601434|nr:mannitol dehydrogenase [Escherichia albertii]WDC21604.1 mannitol dehydrogenase [Escherichia albertii]HEB1317311.1 mannitol dehydrogenase [Escherichia albertii]HEB1322085.1 mannitol dehydrogenase [Escherichia albertii]HEB1335855.1 mannitol dehydrogenase [Escherichia albertii]HEB1349739.1 mannitol dehydrogenase [Escherichia albertii]